MMAVNKSLGLIILLGLTLGGCASWYDTQVQNPESYHHPVNL